MQFSNRAASCTFFAMGPTWSSDQPRGKTPALLTRPCVGFKPTTPQKAAGVRVEPPVSVPNEPKVMSAATAAPEPPLEPPGILFKSHGLWQAPKCGLLVVAPQAYSCRLSLPVSTAPACVNFRTTVALCFGT